MTKSAIPTPPRQRIFDLMQQQDAAVSNASKTETKPVRVLSPAELDSLQQLALRSFVAPEARATA